jgi:hypothetical protein
VTRSALALAPLLALAAAGCGSSGHVSFQHFRSRPDLRPPVVEVRTPARGAAPGYVFFAPKQKAVQAGPLIVDDGGEVVWFDPLAKDGATDFRVQRYRGQPVLTWWQGVSFTGYGSGTYLIVDTSYRRVAEVRAGNGLEGDEHEFLLTPRGTALITIYHTIRRDLSSVGGPKSGAVLEGVVQELDVATGRVLFEWHSIDHVGLLESYVKLRKKDGKLLPYDYFHINSVGVDSDGNLLVSARNTSTVYALDRHTGAVLWRLGGRKSDFAMGPGTRFWWQHDARRRPDGTLTLYDNGAAPPKERYSRALVLRLDTSTHAATLVRAYAHPKRLLSSSQGNEQTLAGGHVFVGWGSNPYFTEFDGSGAAVFDARFSKGADSYRAYRFAWIGRPPGRPAAVLHGRDVYVSWNGATEVRGWQVLAGDDERHLQPLERVAKVGFETRIPALTDAKRLAVRALDGSGRVLGTSATISR